ncbi:MAG: glycosyltransferase [Balneolaceae bacterium]|nr:glycosyltransferase [Balneolaceae bacterium]MBO6546048.1 glycosyltransferase [Balneolaceae bacterium]MBO6647444.1 glycosyltransferase [Balneolaceae bacterium]
MKRILVISFTDLKNDPRVNRQLLRLNKSYDVSCVGLKSPEIEGVKYYPAKKSRNRLWLLITYFALLFRFYKLFYWTQVVVRGALKSVGNQTFDLILANDVESLPIAQKIAKNTTAKIVFDAHEYAPKEHEDKFVWRILFSNYNAWLLKKFTKNISLMFTVCEGIALEFEKNFGLKPLVMTNASEYADIEPTLVRKNDTIRLIHHGAAITSRKIENMIKMMGFLGERFKLDLMLVARKQHYLNELKQQAKNNPNISFIPPVPMQEIVSFLKRYDVGIYILEPNSFNNKYALPNKIFEFIQARLAVAIGPSPEMKKLVVKNEIGIVAEDFSPEALAERIRKLDAENINRYKKNSDVTAKKINSETNMKLLDREVSKLLE